MWALLFGALPSLATAAITAYNKTKDVELGKYQVDGTVDVAALQAATEADKVRRDILIAEQGHWTTRLMRPLGALPFWLFMWKVVVWDKVLGSVTGGSTDALDPNMWSVFMVVIAAYYGSDVLLRVFRK
jgi:hypothetical protein